MVGASDRPLTLGGWIYVMMIPVAGFRSARKTFGGSSRSSLVSPTSHRSPCSGARSWRGLWMTVTRWCSMYAWIFEFREGQAGFHRDAATPDSSGASPCRRTVAASIEYSWRPYS